METFFFPSPDGSGDGGRYPAGPLLPGVAGKGAPGPEACPCRVPVVGQDFVSHALIPPPPRPPALGVFPCRSVDLSGGGDRPELDGVSWILGEPSPRLELRTDRYLPAWASREGLPRLAGRLHLLHVPVPSLRSRSPGRPDGSESAGSGDSRAGLGDKCPDGGSGDTPTSCGWAPLLGMDIFRGRNTPFLSPGRC